MKLLELKFRDKTLYQWHNADVKPSLFSLHIRSMWETTVMHKQVSGWTVNFGPNFPESPFLELKTGIPPHPPFRKTSDLGWPKFTLEYPPPPFWKTSDLGWPKFTPEYPPFGKLQIWDDQSLLRNTPPFWKTSDLGWPKFTLEYPPPNFGKLQIWDDQSLLRNTPPPHWKLSQSPGPRISEYRDLLHVETLSNPDNY